MKAKLFGSVARYPTQDEFVKNVGDLKALEKWATGLPAAKTEQEKDMMSLIKKRIDILRQNDDKAHTK